MFTSHLDGSYLGQAGEPQTTAEASDATSAPVQQTTTAVIPAPVTRFFGLSPQQWVLLAGLALGTYYALQRIRSRRSS